VCGLHPLQGLPYDVRGIVDQLLHGFASSGGAA
jgi:hypothetical protein